MLILPGPVALSQFRKEGLLRAINDKLVLAQLPTTVLENTSIYVHYFKPVSSASRADFFSGDSPIRRALDLLLDYETPPDLSNPNFKALVDSVSSPSTPASSLMIYAIPRPGTTSP